MNSFRSTVLLGPALAVCIGASGCGVVGKIGDRPGASGGSSGAAPPSAMTGIEQTTGSVPTGSSTGDVTGAAGAGDVTGAAGSAPSTGAAGSSGGGAGSAATGAAGATSPPPDAGATAAKDAGATSPPVTMPHCKRGEAYQSNSLADLQTLSKGISWWYNWTTSPEKSAAGYAATGVEYVPMIWGQQGGPPDPATIEKQIPKGAKYLLTFNEPNFAAQANITAAQAAALWPRIEQVAHDLNLKIGSPAPNYCAGDCNDTDPIHYLDTFFAACPGCQVDFIAVHWYACTGQALTNYLSMVKKYNKPIWLTEFSCMDAGDHSVTGEETYMKAALQILENDPTIFRYSWFTGRWTDPSVDVSLLAGDGELTDLGTQYVTTPATDTCGP